jgi:hypothetical protein
MNTEYLLERLVGAALIIALLVFFLAGTLNPLVHYFYVLGLFAALWFLFPNKRKFLRDVSRQIEQQAEDFE